MQTCSWCGGNHDPMVCPYFLNTYIYNPARENYQNSLWSDNYHVIEPQYFVPQEKKSSLKETMESLNRTFESFIEFSCSLQSNSKVDNEGQKEEIISRQPQEFFEEAETHEDEESNIKEDFEWFSNYEKSLSVHKIQKNRDHRIRR